MTDGSAEVRERLLKAWGEIAAGGVYDLLAHFLVGAAKSLVQAGYSPRSAATSARSDATSASSDARRCSSCPSRDC
jgi:hypothetical protein